MITPVISYIHLLILYMKSKFTSIGFAYLLFLFLHGCNNPFAGVDQHDKYQPPEGLAGKLYSQVKAEDNLTTYASALVITGYDEIFDKSGSYTILAPTDSAFEVFFQEHAEYNSIEDIPPAELTRIVKFLTLQNSWNERQFRELSANDGWGSSSSDEWKSSFVYKKETLLEEGLRKVWMDERGKITDSVSANGNYIEMPSDYRKFMPVYTREYFAYNELEDKDYELYFQRDIEINDEIYVADAKILGTGIFAANGFVYKLDKVVLPLKNTEEFLESSGDYTLFLSLLRDFSSASDLFPYKIGNFQLGAEKINTTDERFPMYNHAGMVVPTNRAYVEFIENYLFAQGGMGGVSETFKREIANSFYVKDLIPILSNELENGYYNLNKEKVDLDSDKIIEKKFTSNATVIGYDDFIIPNIFTSVGAPLVFSNKYRLFLDAVLQSKANNALKAMDQIYGFYIIPDTQLEADSSLYISDKNEKLTTFDHGLSSQVQQSASILKTRILNQVSIGLPSGLATKEFLPNLAGNYIVAEKKEDGTVLFSGKELTTFGYNQPDTLLRIEVYPEEITQFDIENGSSFEVDGWFNYSNKASDAIVNRIQYSYSEFFNALRETGYLSQNEQEILFYNEDLPYTVFVPSNEAFLKSNFDAMSMVDKKEFVRTHFVVGKIIFTDGKELPGYYNTPLGSRLNLNPEIDVIQILKPGGELYYSVDVADKNTNVMLTTVKPEYEDDFEFTSYATTAVLHEIDTVLYHTILTK